MILLVFLCMLVLTMQEQLLQQYACAAYESPAGFLYDLSRLRQDSSDYFSKNFVFNVCRPTVTKCLSVQQQIALLFGGTVADKYVPGETPLASMCRKFSHVLDADQIVDFFVPYAAFVEIPTVMPVRVVANGTAGPDVEHEGTGFDLLMPQLAACDCGYANATDDGSCADDAMQTTGSTVLEFRCAPQLPATSVAPVQVSSGCATVLRIDSPFACPVRRPLSEVPDGSLVAGSAPGTGFAPPTGGSLGPIDAEIVFLLVAVFVSCLCCVVAALCLVNIARGERGQHGGGGASYNMKSFSTVAGSAQSSSSLRSLSPLPSRRHRRSQT